LKVAVKEERNRVGSTVYWYQLAQRLFGVVDRMPVKWLLFGCVLLALPIRLSGLDYALPTVSFNEAIIMERVWDMSTTMDLNPRYFNMPGLEFYVNFFMLNFMNVFGATPWDSFVVAARGLQAVSGVVAIPVIYLVAARLYGRRAGIIAAVIFTFLPAHVFYSHMARPDVMAMTFIMLVIYFSIHMLETLKLRHYIAAGVFCGLAVSSQYFGFICLIVPFTAHFIYMNITHATYKDVRPGHLLVLVIAASLVFLYTNPYAVLTPDVFWADFESHWQDIFWWVRETQPDFWVNLNFYFSKTLSDVGLPMTMVFAGGFGYAVWRHNRFDMLNIISCVLFVVFFRFYGEPTMRFMIPLLSLLVVMSSGMLVAAAQRVVKIQHITRRQIGVILLALLPVILLATPISDILAQNGNLQKTSTSELAMAWVSENVSSGSRIFRAANTPALHYIERDGEPVYEVTSGKGPAWEYEDYAAFKADDFEYIILTNSHEKYINNPVRYPLKSEFYGAFYEDYEMVVEFRTDAGEYGASVIEYTKVTNRLLIFRRG
jgi:dolichyl-phosphate-mannose-protein mannosyltransferase